MVQMSSVRLQQHSPNVITELSVISVMQLPGKRYIAIQTNTHW